MKTATTTTVCERSSKTKNVEQHTTIVRKPFINPFFVVFTHKKTFYFQ